MRDFLHLKRALQEMWGTTVYPVARPRVLIKNWPAALYAVGDVHGCLSLLEQMDRAIVDDDTAPLGSKLVVMLGDYVDRGYAPAQVLDYLVASSPPGLRRICLAGNHEEAMLSFLEDPSRHSEWLSIGGAETLRSYGIDLRGMSPSMLASRDFKLMLETHIPHEHIQFLRDMPVMVRLPGVVLVHAGMRSGVTTDLQEDRDLLWIQNVDYVNGDFDAVVVHGHTIVRDPIITSARICVDTGAYRSGKLSAVRIFPDLTTKVLTCNESQKSSKKTPHV